MINVPGSTPNIILVGFCREGVIFTAMQLNKSIKIFLNYFLGPLLFVWLAYSICRQIIKQPHIETSWQHIKQSFGSAGSFHLWSVFLLMFVNWGLEARKWQLSVRFIYSVSFWQAFKAVLSGISFSVTTPNRVGEYFGRMLYMPEGSRLKSIPVTLVGSLSQLIITFFSGIIGLIVLKDVLLKQEIVNDIVYRFVLTGFAGGFCCLALLYFRVAGLMKMLEKWMKNSRHLYLVQSLQSFDGQLLSRLLLLSGLRYLVFVAQYYLLFSLFNVSLSALTVWSTISVLFLAMAVIPTIALAEVGLRGKISLQLLAKFSPNSLGVALTAVTIWLINLVVPAIVGSILFLSTKVFKRKNEIV